MSKKNEAMVLDQHDDADSQLLRAVRNGFLIRAKMGSLTDPESNLWYRIDEAELPKSPDFLALAISREESGLLAGALCSAMRYKDGLGKLARRFGTVPTLAELNVDTEQVNRVLPGLQEFALRDVSVG